MGRDMIPLVAMLFFLGVALAALDFLIRGRSTGKWAIICAVFVVWATVIGSWAGAYEFVVYTFYFGAGIVSTSFTLSWLFRPLNRPDG